MSLESGICRVVNRTVRSHWIRVGSSGLQQGLCSPRRVSSLDSCPWRGGSLFILDLAYFLQENYFEGPNFFFGKRWTREIKPKCEKRYVHKERGNCTRWSKMMRMCQKGDYRCSRHTRGLSRTPYVNVISVWWKIGTEQKPHVKPEHLGVLQTHPQKRLPRPCRCPSSTDPGGNGGAQPVLVVRSR